jgi:hypothetical protein
MSHQGTSFLAKGDDTYHPLGKPLEEAGAREDDSSSSAMDGLIGHTPG